MRIFLYVSSIFIFSSSGLAASRCSVIFESNLTEAQVLETVQKANTFLDKRNENWADRQRCLCCHTTLPYILNRAYDSNSAPNFEKFMERAAAKVNDPSLASWYSSDHVGRNSNPTEAVLNAITLVMYDQARGSELQAVTIKSVDRIFEQLSENNRLHWLDFQLEPFESKAAELWGNSLAILAVELVQSQSSYKAPEPKYQNLKDTLLQNTEALNLNEKATLLWAHSIAKNVLSPAQAKAFVKSLKAAQNENGTWNRNAVLNLGEDKEDVYATSIALIALLKSKVRGVVVDKAAQALIDMQKTEPVTGFSEPVTFWPAKSISRENGVLNNLFASDVATGYASLALKLYRDTMTSTARRTARR